MTPIEIDILLHYATCCGDYRDGDLSAPAVDEAIQNFLARGLLRLTKPEGMSDRDQAVWPNYEAIEPWLQAICEIPLPVQRWVLP